ncbi:RNA polymerase sigma factor [Hugenholtzia roseola]|uniref:RNA polymerase sigma factor n=1 Tax=Hugenholtzia roseola TaxID=1002 RepID=UPI00041F6F8B|nr:RNA polymerase sigma factor [Hugenholtzia roseola]
MQTKTKKNEVSDSELIKLYQNGSEGAFVTLVERHKTRIYGAVYLIVKDAYVAEDILQETFIKVIDTIRSGRYNEEGKFLPWVSRIAHNLAIDHFRKQKRYPTVIMEEGSPVLNTIEHAVPSFEAVKIKEETCATLREYIKKLPKPQKEVLMMRHYFNMSFQEIAETTGVSINTALGRMRYALINLRKLMNQSNETYVNNKNQSKKRSFQH